MPWKKRTISDFSILKIMALGSFLFFLPALSDAAQINKLPSTGCSGNITSLSSSTGGSPATITKIPQTVTCGTCSDGIQNQGETGVDCGGPCSPCVACVPDGSCNPGIICNQHWGETSGVQGWDNCGNVCYTGNCCVGNDTSWVCSSWTQCCSAICVDGACAACWPSGHIRETVTACCNPPDPAPGGVCP